MVDVFHGIDQKAGNMIYCGMSMLLRGILSLLVFCAGMYKVIRKQIPTLLCLDENQCIPLKNTHMKDRILERIESYINRLEQIDC